MVIVNSSLQSPSPMESTQVAKSALQTNKSLDDAIIEFNTQEVQKNSSRFQENLSVMAAQMTGKGLNLDIRG
ncbi:hypothetical protein Sulku_0123 [Sulfuricurvum kujiense DSM 16994]|uniref:Motility protein n=1 Tax=Sulfuricurvum kujiense (strain ATCC BAA-921 / DSM 16994 / JCM 11577 / YK-1) TaxID=709032 RepID=E4TWW0_SULKY|nr:hypothetical protein Sulku_0123 [Sulfuricurvum kujiense DSM 16994]